MEEIVTKRLILRKFRETDAVVTRAFLSGAHRVFAKCDLQNERSWKLLEKAGFEREAHFKKDIYFHKDANGAPIWKDTFVYARLNEDGFKNQK